MRPEDILLDGVSNGLHLGAQLFVALRGETVIDFACGEARAGIPMATNSVVQWYSSGKPLTAVCLAQLQDRGELRFEDRVSRFIPEFAAKGKEAITLRHLLTHTGGFRAADNIPVDTPWEQMIGRICEAPFEAGWVPGEKGGYSTGASWYILAEIIQRIAGKPFPVHIKAALLDPVGMRDSWLRLPFENYRTYGDRISSMHNTAGGKRAPLPLQDAAGMAICRPGASARGPVRELGRFYEMLLNEGASGGRQILKPETVRHMTSRHRTGLYDHTFMHTLDFGLGFIIDSNRYGSTTVPYGYGQYCSERTFGHSGAQSSSGFCDPVNELVVAWVTNGMPGERAHQERQRSLNNAIYEQLRLGTPASRPSPT